MAILGFWLNRQIEQSALNRAASIAAVYVESILATQLRDWAQTHQFEGALQAELDRVFVHGPLQRKVVRFKLWDVDGIIAYSSDSRQIGRRYPIDGLLAEAFQGQLRSRVSELAADDNDAERQRWSRLLEVYVPLRLERSGAVIGVAEFYHSMDNLGHDIHQAQVRSWGVLTLTTIALYLGLLGLVRRASDTIIGQQQDLRERLRELGTSLAENQKIRRQLRDAGEQTTRLNEQSLHRIAADLHDGPAQDLAFALLRFDDLIEACDGAPPGGLEAVRQALRRALDDLRGIATGIGIPGIAELSLADTLQRAVHDFERQSGTVVVAEIDPRLDQASIASKITAYRLLQESLNNAWQHAPAHPPRVQTMAVHGAVDILVWDSGGGFDQELAAAKGRMGIAFMRERVRLLGGVFELASSPGQGTRIHVRLPLLSTFEIGSHA